MKKSILIGNCGYIGKHLEHHLLEAGFDNQSYDLQANNPDHQLDITNPEDFSCLNPEVDFIFLFAGMTGTSVGFEKYDTFNALNEGGLLNLLSWMRQSGCKARVVFPSTRLVFKGADQPLKEEATKETKTIYAVNKLSCEHILEMYSNAFDIPYTTFRICVPYGNVFDGAFSYGTVGFFINKAAKAENITLFGDGSIRRTFTHVSDICTLMIQTLENPASANEVFNLGGQDLSLKEAAHLVAQQYGVDVDHIEWPEMEKRLESGSTVFDDSKLRSIIPVKYANSFLDWLNHL